MGHDRTLNSSFPHPANASRERQAQEAAEREDVTLSPAAMSSSVISEMPKAISGIFGGLKTPDKARAPLRGDKNGELAPTSVPLRGSGVCPPLFAAARESVDDGLAHLHEAPARPRGAHALPADTRAFKQQ